MYTLFFYPVKNEFLEKLILSYLGIIMYFYCKESFVNLSATRDRDKRDAGANANHGVQMK